MKTINQYIFVMLSFFLLVSCNNDGDTAVLSGFGAGELKASVTDIVLTNELNGNLVLSLAWNTAEPVVSPSDKYGTAADLVTNILQFSTESNFATIKEFTETNSAKSFIGSALNSLALNMGAKAGQPITLYARLKSVLGGNVEPEYSNVVSLNITPFEKAFYLYMPKANNYTDFSNKLCSREGDGKYEGYVEAAQWDNFKFSTEASMTTGTVFGSAPNSLYSLDSSSDQWNIWFDEGGYFLVKANTNTLTWSKTAITSFCVTGEFNGWSLSDDPMTYDSTTKKWSVTCNISTVLYGIQIIGNQNWDFKYGDNDATGELSAGESIAIAQTGVYTITMDLSDPTKYTYTITKN
ncbi:DUF5111 domain-containing protein [uncultured Bacteroides sp.]|uniref:DUF5111 domain-containing protein n=1 Tax=uncultured Bacteroides sp. TaxID=162156 RepID=UPI002AAAF93D|nr:DUF5111 domain-containing protein [uncultured Bacteroides sp.]